MTTGIRRAGDFCWINILTPQPAQACEFFGRLLGWTYGEIPGMGFSIKVGGGDIGGLFDLNGPNTPPGTPPVIGAMLKVESADRTAARVTELGGTAMAPFDILDQGRMAVCHDINGAPFDIWEARKGPGMAVDSNLHGAPSWFETMTSDAAKASDFYQQLFGWTAKVMNSGSMPYTTFSLGADFVAGMLQITPEMGPMPPAWLTYFTVDNVEESLRQALKLGAKQCMPVTQAPGVGRFCTLLSPQGVMFYLITYDR